MYSQDPYCNGGEMRFIDNAINAVSISRDSDIALITSGFTLFSEIRFDITLM